MSPQPLVAVIAEDDREVRDLIELVLEQSGFRVVMAEDGPAAIEAVRTHSPLLTTLDVNMPGMDGFAVAKRLREFSSTYLIMITSLTQEIDIIRGFEAGADDYLVKPFRPRELRARADSMLRRVRYTQQGIDVDAVDAPPAPQAHTSWAAQAAAEYRDSTDISAAPAPSPVPAAPATPAAPVAPAASAASPAPPSPVTPVPPASTAPAQPAVNPYVVRTGSQATMVDEAPTGLLTIGDDSPVLRHGPLALDTAARRATLGGRGLDLTRPEIDVLTALMRTGTRVRSRADLVLAVRGDEATTSFFVNEAEKRAVEGHVHSLKRKLGDDGTEPRYIAPVKGVGFRLVA